ncbi:MAG: hypothetical protein FWE40_00180 [Oscillospiraceae bacterium]|nr:hypothetical protein [Oscillospiraceae bacterium]
MKALLKNIARKLLFVAIVLAGVLAVLLFLGIYALLFLPLCIPFVLHVKYTDQLYLHVRWLFLRRQIVPAKAKKKKKDKPEKAKPEEPSPEETPAEPEAPDKPPSLLKRYYDARGLRGFIELLRRTVVALKKFRHGLWLGFCIRQLSLRVHLPGDDPAALAEQYGKLSAAIFPSLGWLTTHLRTRRGKVRAHITPDFTGQSEREIKFSATVSVIPAMLITATLVLLIRLGLRVALKFYIDANSQTD